MRDCTTKTIESIKASVANYIKEHMPFVDATAPAIVEMCMYTVRES